jgi:hypothetical protein
MSVTVEIPFVVSEGPACSFNYLTDLGFVKFDSCRGEAPAALTYVNWGFSGRAAPRRGGRKAAPPPGQSLQPVNADYQFSTL